MTSSLNDTTLSTLSLLESRLLQIEHLLYGQSDISSGQQKSATLKLADLERRFNALTSHIRVYGELLKIYRAHPRLLPLAGSIRGSDTAHKRCHPVHCPVRRVYVSGNTFSLDRYQGQPDPRSSRECCTVGPGREDDGYRGNSTSSGS
uniref:Uncharacterized protein n=1 Tax=Bionectria ochroleuca TaxID=29856 RepID=A0A8H7NL45_BIOOC